MREGGKLYDFLTRVFFITLSSLPSSLLPPLAALDLFHLPGSSGYPPSVDRAAALQRGGEPDRTLHFLSGGVPRPVHSKLGKEGGRGRGREGGREGVMQIYIVVEGLPSA